MDCECVICGAHFNGSHPGSRYCSEECRAQLPKKTTDYYTLVHMRRARFERLCEYAARNRIREITAKYRPQQVRG